MTSRWKDHLEIHITRSRYVRNSFAISVICSREWNSSYLVKAPERSDEIWREARDRSVRAFEASDVLEILLGKLKAQNTIRL